MWTLMLLACAGAINSDHAATKKEYAAIAGVWRFDLVQVDGKKQPPAPFATNQLIIAKDGSYAVIQGKNVTRGTLKLGLAGAPENYDVTILTGRLKGTTFLGIHDLQGDRLRVCFSLKNKNRPTVLASEPGSGLLYEVFAREKQEISEALAQAARIEKAGAP